MRSRGGFIMSYNSDRIGEYLTNSESLYTYVQKSLRRKGLRATAIDLFNMLSPGPPRELRDARVHITLAAVREGIKDYF